MSITQIGQDIIDEQEGCRSGYSVSLNNNGNILAVGARLKNFNSANDYGSTKIYELVSSNIWVQKGSEIIGEAADDESGYSVSLNGLGDVVAIGARYNDNYENGNFDTGHVRVYEFINNDWQQKGQDIDGEGTDDNFGHSVALNNDGNIFISGDVYYDFIEGQQEKVNIGRIRVFEFDENSNNWILKGQPIIGNYDNDFFGQYVSINASGNIIAASSIYHDIKDENGEFITYDVGHVKIYEFINNNWQQIGQDILGSQQNSESGRSISLNNEGNIIAIGEYQYDIPGMDNGGRVRVYERDLNNSWVQKGNDILGKNEGEEFGKSVSLNGDGNILVAGVPEKNIDNNGTGSARIYKFNNYNNNWEQVGEDILAYDESDEFGWAVALNNDGTRVAVTDPRHDIEFDNGDYSSNNGLVRVFDISFTEVPEGEICFLKGTLINTNQGRIPIEKIDINIHTIRNKKIEVVTKSKSSDKYLVCIEKDALGNNIPSERTIISKNHKIFFNGKMITAKEILKAYKNLDNTQRSIYKVKYNGEILYNILLKQYDKMIVNNLICETLHPEHRIAKLYMNIKDINPSGQEKIFKLFNNFLKRNKKENKLKL